MKPCVLIVDDSLTVRMDLDEAFREAGFETGMCATLSTAREALAKTVYSLVVLDILLPDGDGLSLLKEIKSAPVTASMPVLLLTTEAEVRDRIRGFKTGADEYIGKPYDAAYVVSRANELARMGNAGTSGATGRHVLVIDDSATFRASLQNALEALGYMVSTSSSGEDGLRKAATLRPHAIIVDGVLPGIDGATVIRRLRTDTALRHTPCILLTASEDRSNEIRSLDAGADAYVRKESDQEFILARVAAVMRNAAAPAAAVQTSGFLGPKKLLAVDDSRTYLAELADQLRDEGFDIALAHSGEEAIDLLAVQNVDCILLDLIMPGLSGQETCRRIKGSPAWRDIPLIMLTALDESEAMIAGINAGADDYITKSGDFEVLKARVRAQLRRKQFEDENRRIRDQLLEREMEAAEARAAKELAEMRAGLLEHLQHKNEELEAFSYSVSHDLRAPLRAIVGFSTILREDYSDKLDEDGLRIIQNIHGAAARMSELIDALLELSRVGRKEMHLEQVNLSMIARAIADELKVREPGRKVEFLIEDNLTAVCDPPLLRIALTNLLDNAWKYSNKRPQSRIEFATATDAGGLYFFIRDNGAGFDMAYADRLFVPFQRLHGDTEFKGTGVGLATVKRIIERHEGRLWFESAVEQGATFKFRLGAVLPSSDAAEKPGA